MKRRVLIFIPGIVLSLSCTHKPAVKFSDFSFPVFDAVSNMNVHEDSLNLMMWSLEGTQFGDEIFLGDTRARLVTPMADVLRLDAAAKENRINSTEFEARLNRLRVVHERYLIISLELHMPFYPGWTQKQLQDYLDQNLSLTLENGSKNLFYPERLTFQLVERGRPSSLNRSSANLDISVPARAYFKKKSETATIVSANTSKLVLKLRLIDPPPFRVGFFDDKFYQGFRWRVKNQGKRELGGNALQTTK